MSPSEPHEVIGVSKLAGSRVCDDEIDSWCNTRIKGARMKAGSAASSLDQIKGSGR